MTEAKYPANNQLNKKNGQRGQIWGCLSIRVGYYTFCVLYNYVTI